MFHPYQRIPVWISKKHPFSRDRPGWATSPCSFRRCLYWRYIFVDRSAAWLFSRQRKPFLGSLRRRAHSLSARHESQSPNKVSHLSHFVLVIYLVLENWTRSLKCRSGVKTSFRRMCECKTSISGSAYLPARWTQSCSANHTCLISPLRRTTQSACIMCSRSLEAAKSSPFFLSQSRPSKTFPSLWDALTTSSALSTSRIFLTSGILSNEPFRHFPTSSLDQLTGVQKSLNAKKFAILWHFY